MLEQREELKRQAGIHAENLEEYKKALNGIVASPFGQFVFKEFVKALGVFTPKSGRDGVALIEDAARRNFYLQCIRPYLEPELRQIIEG